MFDENEEMNEFKIEANDLLDEAETCLLELDKTNSYQEHFNSIFRAFHSIKGAAGMFGIDNLQAHMHSLETLFESKKNDDHVSALQIDYFLKGVDGARQFLNGVDIQFNTLTKEEFDNIRTIKWPFKLLQIKQQRQSKKIK